MAIRTSAWTVALGLSAALVGTAAVADDLMTITTKQGAQPAPADRPFAPLSLVQVSASQDNSNATFKIGTPVISGHLATVGGNTTPYTGSISLSIATPLGKGSSSTDLGTLDGLSNSTTVALNFSMYLAPGEHLEELRTNPAALALCQEAIDSPKAKEYKLDIPLSNQDCSTTFVRSVLGPAQAAQFNLIALGAHPVYIVGLIPKAGYNDHAFFDAGTLKKDDAHHFEPAIQGFFTYVGPGRTFSMTAAAQYQWSYKDGQSTTVCPTGSTGPTVTCVTGSIGPPKKAPTGLLSLEARGLVGNIGLDPQLTYDLVGHAWGVDVPVYLFSDPKLGFTGGVRGGWTSNQHNFAVAIFVSKAFDITGHN